MYYKIYPSADATIYSMYEYYNAGKDKIIELLKEDKSSTYMYRGEWDALKYYAVDNQVNYQNVLYNSIEENVSQIPVNNITYWQTASSNEYKNSRILIKFDLSKVPSNILQNYSKSFLNIYCADIESSTPEYEIECYAVSQSWDVGNGTEITDENNDGVSWRRRYYEEDWDVVGSSYYNIPFSSQSFSTNAYDINMNTTDIVRLWTSGTIDNNGFLVRKANTGESTSQKINKISFYSMDTHTVYLPELEFVYDDHVYNTSSFYPYNISGSVSSSLITTSDIDIVVKNLKSNYLYETTVRINLMLKKQYQLKTFYENLKSDLIYFINDSLKYSIVDAYTGRDIIPFSDYSKVSLNGSSGYYFDLPLFGGFMPDRFYKIIFKSTIGGQDVYVDKNYVFKITQ